jgi:hypothetical protein
MNKKLYKKIISNLSIIIYLNFQTIIFLNKVFILSLYFEIIIFIISDY